MPPPFDGALVSPELALVDPGLAARARAELPPRGPQRRAPAGRTPGADDTTISRAGRGAAAPALTLLATAAAWLVVIVVSGPEPASGEPATGKLVRASSATTPAQVSKPAEAAATTSAQPAPEHVVIQPSSHLRELVGAGTASVSSTSKASRPAREAAPVRRPARSATTLVWQSSTPASGYDLELVRDGAVIYAARSGAAHVAMPRSWSRDGTAYAIQPEDQAFVWPVVDGRRSGSPVVRGALALEMTPVARSIEPSRRHPRP